MTEGDEASSLTVIGVKYIINVVEPTSVRLGAH